MEQNINKPFFSIIIPTRNRAELLYECLLSIQSQSFVNFECLIIDDGSTDNTKTKVPKLNDKRFKYFFQDHQERSCARNKGFNLSNAQFVCFIDDDDLLKRDYLEVFFEKINNQNYKNEILRVGFETKPLNKKRAPFYNQNEHGDPTRFAAYHMVGIWTLCIPRQYLLAFQFPNQFPHWQDTYLILRLFARYPLRQIEKRLYIYRIHNNMGSRKVEDTDQLLARAESNVAAIRNFEANHFSEVSNSLNPSDFKFLYAEKYAQYSLLAKASNYNKLSTKLMQKSRNERFSFKLWKYYLKYYL